MNTAFLNDSKKNRLRVRVATPTLCTCPLDFAVLQDGEPRRLTPDEFEKLQGFPVGWTSICNKSRRYTLLGNAVTVPVVQHIAKTLQVAIA